MNEDIYYIVTEGGAPATEELPRVDGKAAVVCEQHHLAEEGETLESINSSDLALLLDARADIEVRARQDSPRTENGGQARVPKRRGHLIPSR